MFGVYNDNYDKSHYDISVYWFENSNDYLVHVNNATIKSVLYVFWVSYEH
jgi:hypothetical protein